MTRLWLLPITISVLALSGCGDEEPTASRPQKPAAPAGPKPKVFVADSSIYFFAKSFAGEQLNLMRAEKMREGATTWSPRSADQTKAAQANFILIHSEKNAPWLEKLNGFNGKLIPVADANPDAIPDFEGAAVFDPIHAKALAEAVIQALSDHVLTSETDRARLAKVKAVVGQRYDPLIQRMKAYGGRFQPVMISSGEFQPWLDASGIRFSRVDLAAGADLPNEVIDLMLKQGRKPDMDFVIWDKGPVTTLAGKLKSRGIDGIVLDAGKDPTGQKNLLKLARLNVEALAKLHDPNAAPGIAKAKPDSAPKGNGGTGDGSFGGTVLPFLEKYCIECHDADTGEGEVEFDLYTTIRDAEKVPDLWETVAQLMDLEAMPPRKEPVQPTPAEREQIVAWIEKLSGRWDSGAMGFDPGHTTLRRLNKNEYNYTVRDLFGLRLRPADDFPEETGGEAGFDNNADALFLPPLLMENYVESAGIIVDTVYRDPQARARYLFVHPDSAANARPAARKILQYWASRAYRKPVQEGELERLLKIYDRDMRKKKRFDLAMQMPLVAVLISPNFIYRPEAEKPGNKAYRVSGSDLASRLSYFLWSSMPDQTLFDLAAKNELHKPAVLEQQVARMLVDDRAKSLSMHFAGQWFKWESLRSTANPDEKRFPSFTFQLRVSLYQESTNYFSHLLQNDSSILELIHSDYAFLNEPLARHYGIQGVTGMQFRKVPLTDRNRGGVLGMGSVLTATSLPLRSSPAIRGNWVLNEIFGTPTPEPPMNVEQLPDDDRAIKGKTFREELVQHRENPSCKACHEAIDPLGFGLENFDAIGRWRVQQNGKPIDSTGVLPDGAEFQSPAELKQILLEDKDLFTRNMVRKALAYALGRELTPYDRPIVAEIAEKVKADNYRIQSVFLEVAKSYPFQMKRNSGFVPTKE
ncbi:MAG: DUF1592 domain-containing protein, partial [Verrucomicrobiales bacterium]|nr:DUF1592 domain-containing protein [Verrucomicrobiales bacterium]